ncbi:MAG TPA: hypothetical protein VFA11_02450 [Acidimicrobiales bacterium]|nr:hypothetical protein [Acidimicrobiales bacterium]
MPLKRLPSKIRPRDERGDMLIAVAVLMIILIMGTTLMARTVANVDVVTHQENFSGALANADAGLSDALFQLDQGRSASFCVGPPSGCAEASVPGAAGVEYRAILVNNNQWKVQSLGSLHGVPHGIQSTVSRAALFPFAMFGKNLLDYRGNINQATFDSYTQGSGPVNPSGQVQVGSDGTLYCNAGGLPANVSGTVFEGNSASTTGNQCPGATTATGSWNPPPVYPPGYPNNSLNAYQGCPDSVLAGGVYQMGTPGQLTYVTPGIYLCDAPVLVVGDLALGSGSNNNGEVQIYIDLPSTLNTTATTDWDAPGLNVNYEPSGGSFPANLYPDAYDFQWYSNGVGNFGSTSGSSNSFTIGGIIDAPGAYLIGDGCKSTYYGALIINTLSCNGGPNLTINFDSNLTTDMGPWGVSAYTEVGACQDTSGGAWLTHSSWMPGQNTSSGC